MYTVDGNKIKQLRLEKGYTQQEVADEVGTTKTSIMQYEKGHVVPNAAVLANIAFVLGARVNDFFLYPVD